MYHQRLYHLEPVLHYLPQLLALVITRVLYLQISPLRYYLLRSEWSLGILPS